MKVRKIYRGFIVNDAEAVCEAVRSIISCLENSFGINSDQSFDIRIILSELLQNAIEHGNLLDCSTKVYMDVCIRDRDNLNITIKDKGQGFDARRHFDMNNNKVACSTDVFEIPDFG